MPHTHTWSNTHGHTLNQVNNKGYPDGSSDTKDGAYLKQLNVSPTERFPVANTYISGTTSQPSNSNTSSYGATETRPENLTYRIWKRIS